MAFKTKIDSSFWSDDDVGRLSAEQKVAILWLLTTKDMNNIGFLKVSRRQFQFDTGLSIETLETALRGLPRSFMIEDRNGGLEVLAINYVHYQFSDRSLSGKNNIVKHLCTLFRSLTEPMQDAILERYPDLKPALKFDPGSPLQAPSKDLLSPLQAPSKDLLSPLQAPTKELASPLQGAYKPPEQSRAEQSRASDPEGDARGGPVPRRFDLAVECVNHLNACAGTKFPPTSAVLEQVVTRLQEVGNDLPAVKRMIERQAALWKNDPKMKAYLRPVTLFDPEKFASYFGQRETPAVPLRAEERRQELERWIERSPANRESVYHRPSEATESDREQLLAWRRELRALTKNFAPEPARSPNV